jgi:N-sulfoglucosamine sulfohydrolase
LNYHKPASALSAGERNNPLYKSNRVKPQYMTLIELLRENGYYQGVTHKLHVAPVEKFPYDEFMTGSRSEVDQFMKNAKAAERPWFLMVNIPYSHRPYPNSDKVKIRVKPEEVELPSYLPDTPMIRQDWAEYLAGIEKADQVAGQALDALKASGQYDNTIIIYMSDHGPTYPHGKMTLHDLGLRVPLAISGPGVEKNRLRDDLVNQIDLLPTVMDFIADVSDKPLSIPADKQKPGAANSLKYDFHGQSIYSLLTDSNATGQREYIFGEVSARGPIPNDGLQERSVTDGRWKLIYREKVETRWRQVNDDTRMLKTWGNRTYAETIRLKDEFPEAYRVLREMDPQNLDGQIPKLELYDWKSDPDEMNNLAGQEKFQSHQQRLLDQLQQWKIRTKDESIELSVQ